MSRSNPALTNPCSKFIEIKADTGRFFYYDKDLEKQVDIPLPIYFTVLDELATITGFNKKHKSSIFSNDIHSSKKEILRVRTFKGGESVTGLYQDIRDSIVAMGGHYTKSVYALMVNQDKTMEFVNFKFKGASFSAWLDKKFDPMKFIVGVTEFIEETNGATTYMVPIFKNFKLTPEIDAEALKYDAILQEYLVQCKAREPEVEIAKAEAANPITDEPKEEFVANPNWAKESRSDRMERAKAAMEPSTPPKGKQPFKAMSDDRDLEIPSTDLSDLPF